LLFTTHRPNRTVNKIAANANDETAPGPEHSRFAQGLLHQNDAIRRLEVIGEAASRVSSRFRDAHPNIPWSEIVGMRNWLTHNHCNVSLDIVWDVLQIRLPELIAALEPLIRPDDEMK
jgi:uncharacterized protein with HEPN domain